MPGGGEGEAVGERDHLRSGDAGAGRRSKRGPANHAGAEYLGYTRLPVTAESWREF